MMLTKATQEDFVALCRFYQCVTDDMRASGLVQWNWGQYPNEALIQQDLDDDCLYVLREDGELVCAVSINCDFEPVYDSVDWHFTGKPGTFHRLAIATRHQGRGMAKQLLPEIIESIRNLGCDCLRIDTFCDNHRALYLYETWLGMRRAGEFFYDGEGDGKPYIPLEMKL